MLLLVTVGVLKGSLQRLLYKIMVWLPRTYKIEARPLKSNAVSDNGMCHIHHYVAM